MCGENFYGRVQFFTQTTLFAGNSIRGGVETFDRKGYFENKTKDSLFLHEIHQATHRLDVYLKSIAKSCNIILMPGEFDPSCHAIPQHSLHPQILPLSSRYDYTHFYS